MLVHTSLSLCAGQGCCVVCPSGGGETTVGYLGNVGFLWPARPSLFYHLSLVLFLSLPASLYFLSPKAEALELHRLDFWLWLDSA